MLFTDKEGKFYEIPNDEFVKYEVSSQRAKEIIDTMKDILVKSGKYTEAEVQGYSYGQDLANIVGSVTVDGFNSSNVRAIMDFGNTYNVDTIRNSIR